jgi:hypothetical protein
MRTNELFPVKYYHVVFTVPDKLNALFLAEPKKMYNLLFTSSWETIRKFGLDYKHLGAKTGMIAVLHTWGQNLALHPHVHCLVPAGGITKNGKWRNTRGEGKFLFPVKAMSKVFRGEFTDGLIALHNQRIVQLETPFIAKKKYLHPLYKKRWVVYAKLPMHNAEQVVNYIGKYTHRIAISNHRIKSGENNRVKFSVIDYRTSKTHLVDLSGEEFLRRFSLHILPVGFMKIRHYGILSSKAKEQALDYARKSLGTGKPAAIKPDKLSWGEWLMQLYGKDVSICPKCKTGKMLLADVCYPRSRGSPQYGIRNSMNLPFAS